MAAAHQNAAGPTNNKPATTTTITKRRRRFAEGRAMAWTVLNVFSPAIPNTFLRLLALWGVSTYIVLAFVGTVLLSAVAEYAPFLKPRMIDMVLALFVPRQDAFSKPFADVIRESTRQ